MYLSTVHDEQLIELIKRCVSKQIPHEEGFIQLAGVALEQQSQVSHLRPLCQAQAAVLVPIVARPEGLTVLLTRRANHLRQHAGQIGFPGGRIESFDAGPTAAALRETEEEIGLSRDGIHTLGFLPQQLVTSGYCVTPVVGIVEPEFVLRLDSNEVDEVFEVPVRHFLDPAHHQVRLRSIENMSLRVYDIPYGERRIWGATAGIIMSLYHLLVAHSGQL